MCATSLLLLLVLAQLHGCTASKKQSHPHPTLHLQYSLTLRYTLLSHRPVTVTPLTVFRQDPHAPHAAHSGTSWRSRILPRPASPVFHRALVAGG